MPHKDNRVGFDGSYDEQLFQRFKRLHNEEAYPGGGIGLATVERVVKRHGGVWARSELGKGAEFCFTLASGF